MIPFKGKQDSELQTLEQVRGFPEYAGILGNDVILIDVDDKEQSEKMLQIVKDLKLREQLIIEYFYLQGRLTKV